MKRRLVRLCAVVILLAVPLGAFSLMQMSVAQAAETVVPVYGCPATLDGSPIGGGVGYLDTIDPSQADYVVSTAAALKSALASATSGQIVYVADGATITVGSTALWYYFNLNDQSIVFNVPAGVTLAGGRGRAGVTGGIIQLTYDPYPTGGGQIEHGSSFIKCGTGANVCGLTLVGMQETVAGLDTWGCIGAGTNSEIHNNEIHGWGYVGVQAGVNITNAWVHHNYIHHVQREGYGCAIDVNGQDIYHTASLIAEGNVIDYYRHAMSAAYGRSSYIFRYNYIGANGTNNQIDVHGNNDDQTKVGGEYLHPAGENIEIYNNTSVHIMAPNGGPQPLVWVRGTPYSTGFISVHHNWSYISEDMLPSTTDSSGTIHYGGPISQSMYNLPENRIAPYEGAFVRTEAYDNWWGTTAPPSTSYRAGTNQTPLTPATPGGTVSGQTGTSYTYSVKTTDPDGDSIAYTVDWGDGTSSTTGQLNSGVSGSASHTWTQSGTYAIWVKATDSKGNLSAWSPSLSVVIAAASQPPLTPGAPEGTMSGVPATALQEQGISAATDASAHPLPVSLDTGDPLVVPAHRSGLVWWLLIISVILSAVVLLVRAIVRTAVAEAPSENALPMRRW